MTNATAIAPTDLETILDEEFGTVTVTARPSTPKPAAATTPKATAKATAPKGKAKNTAPKAEKPAPSNFKYLAPGTPAEIKAAYRALALKLHPLMGGTSEQMLELNLERDRLLRPTEPRILPTDGSKWANDEQMLGAKLEATLPDPWAIATPKAKPATKTTKAPAKTTTPPKAKPAAGPETAKPSTAYKAYKGKRAQALQPIATSIPLPGGTVLVTSYC